MQVKVLGSAAGGGFPQWNCACDNCRALRAGQFAGKPRTQSQLAVSGDGESWHLLNASPDLRQQILANAKLQPQSAAPARQSPIQSITLTNADLDHALGILLLRESIPLRICTTESVRKILKDGNSFFRMLEQFPGHSEWATLEAGAKTEFKGIGKDAKGSNLWCTPVAVSEKVPLYARAQGTDAPNAVIGLVIEDGASKKRVGYFPGLGEITQDLFKIFSSCDVLLIDGTFWSEQELISLHGKGRTATEMGHIPVGGKSGSLEMLKSLPPRTKKFYIHINNTNPILNEESEAAKTVRDAGWIVSHDGLEITL